MPKAKPVSLHPLSFEEAVKALLAAEGKKEKKADHKGKAKGTPKRMIHRKT